MNGSSFEFRLVCVCVQILQSHLATFMQFDALALSSGVLPKSYIDSEDTVNVDCVQSTRLIRHHRSN